LLHSRDFETQAPGETEFRHRYERALARSAQLRARRTRLRAAAGTAAVACLVVAGLVTASAMTTTPQRQPVARSSMHHTTWRLVSDIAGGASSWRVLSPSDYEQTFSLVCPGEKTCYADSTGGQLEYTHDGGSTWRQATGTVRAVALPQISCVDAQACDVLAELAGRGSTLLTTTDGGQTWTSHRGPPLVPNVSQDGPGADLPGLGMSCARISSCVVVGYAGASSARSRSQIFRTSDGGVSWSQSTFPPPGSREFVPSGLSCTGTTCVAVGFFGQWHSESGPGGRAQGVSYLGGAAYTSDDGGARWSASSAPPVGVSSLSCPGDTDCYALAPSAVFETEDGGQTWDQVKTSGLPGPSSGWNFISMSCASSSSCWLTGAGTPASRPANSSAQRSSSPGHALRSVSVGQARALLASTVDSGASWAVSTAPARVGGVIDVSCPNTSTCFALGAEQNGSAPGHIKVVLLTNTP